MEKLKIKSLNEQVKEYLLQYIKEMDLSQGKQLPKEEILAEQLGVSRVTIRRVLAELAQEGLISRKHGKGTFVNQEVVEIKIPLNIGPEFKDIITKSKFKADVKLLGYRNEVAGEEIANKMKINKNDKIIIIEKVFYADKKPAIFCIDRFPEKLLSEPLVEQDVEKAIFTILYEKAKKKVLHDVTEVSTIQISDNEKLKNIFKKEKSLLVFEAINFDQDDNIVLYDTEYYDTDFIKFSICRKKDIHY